MIALSLLNKVIPLLLIMTSYYVIRSALLDFTIFLRWGTHKNLSFFQTFFMAKVAYNSFSETH